jgi:two-component system, NarL family, sensor histidine kinase FusK
MDWRTAYLIKAVILFAVYFVTARIGLSLDAVSGFAAAVWPPAGIALVAMLVLGSRYWPGIFLAATLVNLSVGAPPLVAMGIGMGNTLEALVGAYLLTRVIRFQPALERVRDILGLVVLAAIISTLISATVGVTCLLLGDVISYSSYASTWMAWWRGDMLGTIVVAPLMLAWIARPRVVVTSRRIAEALVLVALLIGVSFFAFHASLWVDGKPFTFAYIIFPLLIWIALRFRQRGSTAAIFLVSVVAVWSTVSSFDDSLSQSLLLLQGFMGFTAITFMTMAAIVSEQEQTQKRQQQLAQKTELLTKQRLRLLALNKAKDEFISLASHQLRTPATGVKQYLNMLLEGYAGKLTQRQHDMVLVANAINERAIQIINDLLKVAQVDAGRVKLRLERVDLVALIADMLKDQASAFDERNQTVAFAYQGGFHIYADKTKLRMVIENILDNASKYSPPGKELKISLGRNKDRLTIAIQDNGIGIGRKDRAKLFKKFSRIDNPASVFVAGTGLGLYWANKIISLHGGSITVASKPNEGSVFTISLPTARKTKPPRSKS